MKKLLFLGNLLIIGLLLQAQTPEVFGEVEVKNVPKAVLSNFHKITNQSADEWGAFKNRYQATSEKDKHRAFYRFNDEGLYKETLVKLNWEKDAPKGIKEGKSRIQQKYWKVNQFYEVTDDSEDISYILVLEDKDGKLATVFFDKGGNLRDKETFQ